MATIKDVAKLAGVSISTVSRALSEKIFVDPMTKKKVMQAVKTLGYRPNFLAKGLKEGKTGLIALIIPDISNPYYPRLVHCVEKHAVKNGYSLLLYNTNEDVEQEKNAIATLKNRYVDGVIVTATSSNIRHFLNFMDEGVPLVMVNRWYPDDINCISNDQLRGAYDVVKYLISHGHKKISVVLRNFDNTIYNERYQGCMMALNEAGLGESEKYFMFNVNTADESRRRTMEMLSRDDRPTAIFMTNDTLSFGIYSAAYSLHLRIPQDISIVGFDNLPTSEYMIPPLTSYEQDLESIGEKSVENLIRQIEHKQEKPDKVIIRGTIIERESVQDIQDHNFG